MNLFINSKLVENIGWTLLHSLWQIALIAFVLFILLKILRGFSANVRYFAAAACAAKTTCAACAAEEFEFKTSGESTATARAAECAACTAEAAETTEKGFLDFQFFK